MSTFYPQYPNYPQPPQPPGWSGQVGGQPGGSLTPPDQTPAAPTYTPVDLPSGTEWANLQSRQLSNIAAGKTPSELGVKSEGPPADFPLLMYNAQTRTTKAATDAQDEAKLSGQGYSKTPFPAEPVDAAQVMQVLQDLWAKGGEVLKQMAQIVDQQQKQMQAAGNVLNAGQQEPPMWSGQQQQSTGD